MDTEPQPPTAEGMPQRELRDPRELRALAHPVRLGLLEELATLGEATATELADRVGQSPANCSWHLRQLAKYGFIEEAAGGTGRQRPWRWVPQATSISEDADTAPELRVARDAAVDVILDRHLDAWHTWTASRGQAPEAWSQSSFGSSSHNWLTAEELAALKRDLEALFERHIVARLDRVDPERRPPGAHLIRFLALGFPAGRVTDLPETAVPEPTTAASTPHEDADAQASAGPASTPEPTPERRNPDGH